MTFGKDCSLKISRDRKGTVRSTFDPSMLCLDRCCLLESQFFCCFAVLFFNNGTPAYICDRIGKETGKYKEPQKGGNSGRAQTCIWEKFYNSEIKRYDWHYKRHGFRQISFGQVSNLLLLGFDHFRIVLMLRVPANKTICFAIKLVNGIIFSFPKLGSRMDIAY